MKTTILYVVVQNIIWLCLSIPSFLSTETFSLVLYICTDFTDDHFSCAGTYHTWYGRELHTNMKKVLYLEIHKEKYNSHKYCNMQQPHSHVLERYSSNTFYCLVCSDCERISESDSVKWKEGYWKHWWASSIAGEQRHLSTKEWWTSLRCKSEK